MPGPLRQSFADLCRSTRLGLDVSRAELAKAAGISKAYIGELELGAANPSFEVAERVLAALGLEARLLARPPTVIGSRSHDSVHAWCSAYAHRRLLGHGLTCDREILIADGRTHGWIDLLAFDGRSGVLYVIEVKTQLLDVGAVERQLGWYERQAWAVGRRHGWRVRQVVGWLLLLASEEVAAAMADSRTSLAMAFPARAVELRAQLAGEVRPARSRGLALIDPRSRRREWLQTSRLEGRWRPMPYRDYADAANRLRGG